MKTTIKGFVAYKAAKELMMPTEQEMIMREFSTPEPSQQSRQGFVKGADGKFFTDLGNGDFILTHRKQDKVISKPELARRLKEVVKVKEAELGSKLKKGEIKDLEVGVILDLLPLTFANEPKDTTVMFTKRDGGEYILFWLWV